MFFNKNNKEDTNTDFTSCVGVDIGTYAIKIIQIKKESNKLFIETYGELELASYDSLPPGSISNIGEEKMINAINDLIRASKITSNNYIFSIPMSECFVSSINIPKVSDKELSNLLPIEARKYLPLPISEVKLNYWRNNINTSDESKEDVIVLAAIKNSVFDMYERIVKRLNITNYSFEIEAVSETRAIALSLPNEEIIFSINIGGKVSFISLIRNNVIVATNIIQKGSYNNTFQISKALSLSIDVAEEAKRVFGYFGDDSSPHLAEIMSLASFPLFDEAKSLLFSFERKYNIEIQKVVISGGGALPKGIINILSKFLGKKIILLEPFSQFSLPENVREKSKEISSKYSIATGLSLKNFFN